jgi:hypothetical protein
MGGDGISHREEESSYEHVCHSELSPRYICFNFHNFDFFLWGWMKSEVDKSRPTHETNCPLAVWRLLPA